MITGNLCNVGLIEINSSTDDEGVMWLLIMLIDKLI